MWGGTEEQRKMHLVSWETINKDKENGGLGIRSMRQANAAFLSKLGWRILVEPNTLWARVLRNKYCDGKFYLEMFKHKPNSSNAWKGIVENIDILRQGVWQLVMTKGLPFGSIGGLHLALSWKLQHLHALSRLMGG